MNFCRRNLGLNYFTPQKVPPQGKYLLKVQGLWGGSCRAKQTNLLFVYHSLTCHGVTKNDELHAKPKEYTAFLCAKLEVHHFLCQHFLSQSKCKNDHCRSLNTDNNELREPLSSLKIVPGTKCFRGKRCYKTLILI